MKEMTIIEKRFNWATLAGAFYLSLLFSLLPLLVLATQDLPTGVFISLYATIIVVGMLTFVLGARMQLGDDTSIFASQVERTIKVKEKKDD